MAKQQVSQPHAHLPIRVTIERKWWQFWKPKTTRAEYYMILYPE